MKSFKSVKLFVVASVMALIGGLVSHVVYASVPSASATIQARAVPKDGNGNLFMNQSEIGFKVFVTTSTSAILVVDENGVAPTSGLLHQVCVSSGATTEWAITYDSYTVTPAAGFTSANIQSNYQYETAPPANRVVASEHCTPFLDSQFNYGLVSFLPTSAGAGTVHVYWRPSRGGSN